MQHLCAGSLASTPESLQVSGHVKGRQGFSRCIELIHIIHRLCGSPSIPLSFNLATVLPRRSTSCVSFVTKEMNPQQLVDIVRAWTTRVSNPVCSPRFRARASVLAQEAAFAIDVPPHLYAFHCYTWNSTSLCHTLVCQSRMLFPGSARGFHFRLDKPPTHLFRPVIPINARTLRITAAAGT